MTKCEVEEPQMLVSTSKKEVKKSTWSATWQYFTSGDRVNYTCVLCRKELRASPQSSSNLKRHLVSKHRDIDWNAVYVRGRVSSQSSPRVNIFERIATIENYHELT